MTLIIGVRCRDALVGCSARTGRLPQTRPSPICGPSLNASSGGREPWPKLFQNMRASRETELTAEYPLNVVCAWIGNSPAVAQTHYLQVKRKPAAKPCLVMACGRLWRIVANPCGLA